MQKLNIAIAAGLIAVLGACAAKTPDAGPGVTAAPAAREFPIFFDGESTTLTPEAARIVADFVGTANAETERRIQIEAEASGDSAHAAFLAKARETAVEHALVADGIQPARLDIRAHHREPTDRGVTARRVFVMLEPR